jgi:hypothetical protein
MIREDDAMMRGKLAGALRLLDSGDIIDLEDAISGQSQLQDEEKTLTISYETDGREEL